MEQPLADAADDVVALRRRHHAALLRVATGYVGSQAVAEDVVQEAWLGATTGLGRFEGRSSLKTWMFRILENVAKTTARREARSVPFSSVTAGAGRGDGAGTAGGGGDPGHESGPLEDQLRRRPWGTERDEGPESRLLFEELCRLMGHAIAALPPRERAVLTLRALQGLSAQEVCDLLQISDANQRVTLHRARSRVLAHVGPYLGEDPG